MMFISLILATLSLYTVNAQDLTPGVGLKTISAGIKIDLTSYTTSKCNCNAVTHDCQQLPSFINEGCEGNCGNRQAWCDLSVHICVSEISGDPKTNCPTISSSMTCDILDNYSNTHYNSLTADINTKWVGNMTSHFSDFKQGSGKFIAVKMSGVHHTGLGYIPIDKPYIECFHIDQTKRKFVNVGAAAYQAKVKVGCAEHFYGPNCDIVCTSTETIQCDENGNKQCKPYHFDHDCSTYCVENEKYSCNKYTGSRTCKENFFGEDCETFCLNTKGNKCVQEGGQVLCKNEWFGPNCDKYCSKTGSRQCNENGDLECKPGFVQADNKCRCEDVNVCDPVNSLESIPEGYDESSSNTTAIIVGSVVGGVVFIALIAALVVFIVYKKKQEKKVVEDKAQSIEA